MALTVQESLDYLWQGMEEGGCWFFFSVLTSVVSSGVHQAQVCFWNQYFETCSINAVMLLNCSFFLFLSSNSLTGLNRMLRPLQFFFLQPSYPFNLSILFFLMASVSVSNNISDFMRQYSAKEWDNVSAENWQNMFASKDTLLFINFSSFMRNPREILV